MTPFKPDYSPLIVAGCAFFVWLALVIATISVVWHFVAKFW